MTSNLKIKEEGKLSVWTKEILFDYNSGSLTETETKRDQTRDS